MAITSILAKFEDVSLTSITGVSVLATDPYQPPRRKLSTSLLARTDKNRTNSAYYVEKRITVDIAIQRPTRDLVEASLDALMALLQGVCKELVLSQSGSVRKYTCTLQDTIVRKSGGAYLEMSLIFFCDDVFGYDTGYSTSLNLTGITSATRGDAIPFGGSAPWQVPLIKVSYTALTGGTAKTVTIGNAATGQQIIVTRTWTTGDVLEIDCANRTVKVNGTEVAFTGGFPEFAPALGNWSYSDNLTTRTFNALITYYKRYI